MFDTGRLVTFGIQRRHELLCAGDVDALDQVVLGVLGWFGGEGDAGGVPFRDVECLGGGSVDPCGQPGA